MAIVRAVRDQLIIFVGTCFTSRQESVIEIRGIQSAYCEALHSGAHSMGDQA